MAMNLIQGEAPRNWGPRLFQFLSQLFTALCHLVLLPGRVKRPQKEKAITPSPQGEASSEGGTCVVVYLG